MDTTTMPQHNYLRKLRRLMASGALPRDVGVHQLDIAHDDWCDIFTGRRCNCDPTIRVRWSQSAVRKN